MSNIDKQALREAAERAMHDDWGYDTDIFHEQVTPSVVLALLDELDKKQQYIKLRDQENEDIALTVGKLRVELEAAKKRIAELEKGHQEAAKQINSWRRLAKQNIAERGKDISELEAARQRIAELEDAQCQHESDTLMLCHQFDELASAMGWTSELAMKQGVGQLEYARSIKARIAELEAKLETADKLQDGAFRDGLKAGFSYGQTDDQSGFAQCMSAYSTRTGIKVKE
ncbi:ead/Ea22-like family protein [Salmonella enterica subsp. enterica]|nr:ead/Ea22-like family protein [Salmonella enterica subsp. enterica]